MGKTRPKSRQSKGKARLNGYESMLNETVKERKQNRNSNSKWS